MRRLPVAFWLVLFAALPAFFAYSSGQPSRPPVQKGSSSTNSGGSSSTPTSSYGDFQVCCPTQADADSGVPYDPGLYACGTATDPADYVFGYVADPDGTAVYCGETTMDPSGNWWISFVNSPLPSTTDNGNPLLLQVVDVTADGNYYEQDVGVLIASGGKNCASPTNRCGCRAQTAANRNSGSDWKKASDHVSIDSVKDQFGNTSNFVFNRSLIKVTGKSRHRAVGLLYKRIPPTGSAKNAKVIVVPGHTAVSPSIQHGLFTIVFDAHHHGLLDPSGQSIPWQLTVNTVEMETRGKPGAKYRAAKMATPRTVSITGQSKGADARN